MQPVDLIRKKRDGGELSAAELRSFVAAAAGDGSWQSYQLSAMLMAICIRGMTHAETAHFTRAMTDSGRTIDLAELPGIMVDKHSTGGVGDKTSLVIAPLVAACGVVVPMMSGRGLGHTGGTLDKLEAIPGFRVGLSIDEFKSTLLKVGTAMISQTPEVAPADKKLYALRDVTGTVESIPLITASILSKKLAEGISALVMDVKCGSGAFMKTQADARLLAESLVRVGSANGLKIECVITDMETPLGREVGNLNEVREAVEILQGRTEGRLAELSILLAAKMLKLAGVVGDDATGIVRIRAAIADDAGLHKFHELVEAQGGSVAAMERAFRTAPGAGRRIVADHSGRIHRLDAELIGRAAVALGAGRRRVEDDVDAHAGVTLLADYGDPVRSGDPLFAIFATTEHGFAEAGALLREAVAIDSGVPPTRPLILETIFS